MPDSQMSSSTDFSSSEYKRAHALLKLGDTTLSSLPSAGTSLTFRRSAPRDTRSPSTFHLPLLHGYPVRSPTNTRQNDTHLYLKRSRARYGRRKAKGKQWRAWTPAGTPPASLSLHADALTSIKDDEYMAAKLQPQPHLPRHLDINDRHRDRDAHPPPFPIIPETNHTRRHSSSTHSHHLCDLVARQTYSPECSGSEHLPAPTNSLLPVARLPPASLQTEEQRRRDPSLGSPTTGRLAATPSAASRLAAVPRQTNLNRAAAPTVPSPLPTPLPTSPPSRPSPAISATAARSHLPCPQGHTGTGQRDCGRQAELEFAIGRSFASRLPRSKLLILPLGAFVGERLHLEGELLYVVPLCIFASRNFDANDKPAREFEVV